MPNKPKQVFPEVPVRLPDGQWRVWHIGRPVVPIINREGLRIEIRPLDHRRCIQGTGERKEWLLLHIALTLAIEQRPGKHQTEKAYRETRKRLDHLVGYSPALGDKPA
jgi:hypothetical protein